MTIEHSNIQTGEQHVLANWVVSSLPALTALQPVATDVGKVAWVAGRGHYVLAASDPAVWELLAPTVATVSFVEGTDVLTITLTDGSSFQATIPLGTTVAEANALIAAALTDYYTAAQIDTIVSGIGTALSGKEPSIEAGTASQYWRGDKTWQPLDADAVAETASRVYLSPAQKTVATQAATSLLNGYLSGTDWATFNGKQAALANVITAGTYGSSTQYPIITYNAKGIATGVTLQTVSAPTTFSDSAFRVQDNADATKQVAFEASGIATATTRTITVPNANINLGDLPSVATTNSNVRSGTRTHIVGGSSNTVSGTDNIVVGGDNNSVSGTNAQVVVNTTGLSSSPFTQKSILLGASNKVVGIDSLHSAALGGITCLYKNITVTGGTEDITADSGIAAVANSLKALFHSTATGGSVHDIDFIVSIGNDSTGLGVIQVQYTLFATRRVVIARTQGGAMLSTVLTVGTDTTLGNAATGTLSVSVFVDTANNRIVPRVTTTTGLSQDRVECSVRVTSHYNRK